MHCSSEQWALMVKMLWDSSKVRSIDLQDVFHANGKRFLCGLCSGIDQSGCWVTSRAYLSSHGMVEEVGSPDCLPPEKPAAVPLAVLEGHEDSSKFGTLKK